MSDAKTASTTTFPILGVLGLIFITLKLTGHIDWSWWWVTAPFWGPLVLIAALLGIFCFGYAIYIAVRK
jgi:hypothetical protein